MKYLLFVIINLSCTILYSQLTADDIDFSRIPQKKIREYMLQQVKSKHKKISDLHPSCNNCSDFPGIHSMKNMYLVKESPQKVWQTYLTANMSDVWNGKIISFGLLCSKWSDYILYKNSDDYCGLDTGQVFFINLRILKGLYNLPVGIQIDNIDEMNMKITFSYLEGGKSIGTQTITLVPADHGYTEVIHESSFKSSSHFRDKRLYPFYHTKVLNEFHRNIAKNITKDKDFFFVLSSSKKNE